MTTRILPEGRAPWLDSEGKPLANGYLYTYEPDTSALKATYQDRAKTTAHQNPIRFDADGRPPAPIFWDGAYKYRLETSGGVLVDEVDDYGEESAVITNDGASLLPNGGFEIDSDADGTPDEWTLIALGTNTVTIDDTVANAYSGTQSLKFTTTDGGPAGVATSARIPWAAGEVLYLFGATKSNNANLTNSVVVYWYSDENTVISSTTAYTDSGVAPTTYTAITASATAPANTKYAEVRINGADGGGTEVGASWFDDLRVERVVERARDADNADSADLATEALNADNADLLDGHTAEEVASMGWTWVTAVSAQDVHVSATIWTAVALTGLPANVKAVVVDLDSQIGIRADTETVTCRVRPVGSTDYVEFASVAGQASASHGLSQKGKVVTLKTTAAGEIELWASHATAFVEIKATVLGYLT